jgi:hypothetical protein
MARTRLGDRGTVVIPPNAADPIGGVAGDMYYNTVSGKMRYFNTAWHDFAEIVTFDLIELNETFEHLTSGTNVTITNYQVNDIILVHRNGLFKRPNVDYVRNGAVITFFLAFGSSSGTPGDGEIVSVVSLRQP